MAAKKGLPEPLQPGDEQIAREEIEAYYTGQVDQARANLEEAQARFDREQASAEAAITAFRGGERLPDVDDWSIEVHAGGASELGLALMDGRSTDRAAYDLAKERQRATMRWLRTQGYGPLSLRGGA